MAAHSAHRSTAGGHDQSSYTKLAITSAIHLVVMYLLMYSMIESFSHFYSNLNQVYMALLMVSPMVVIMLIAMRPMYQNARLNGALIAASAAVFLMTFLLVRTQSPVGDEQFLRSMIPHHSSAILMCEQASITDPAIQDLCERIIRAQKQEIAEMQALLQRG